MRIKSNEHEELNEDIQNLLSYIGDLIDDAEDIGGSILMELYEWLEGIMVIHYEHNIAS